MLGAKVVQFKMMPCVKKNGHILDISLDMCPTMHHPLVTATANHLQHICYLAEYACSILTMSEIHSFANMIASNNTIKLISTGTGT